MIRDPLGNKDYWDRWIDFTCGVIADAEGNIEKAVNIGYLPQYVFHFSKLADEKIFRCYSRGDPISALKINFSDVLMFWERSEKLGASIWSDEVRFNRNSWKVNLDFYINCFWLVGLAILLDIGEEDGRD